MPTHTEDNKEKNYHFLKILNIWWLMPLFLIYYFHRLILTRVHFTYSNIAWGLHGGVDVMWCRGLFVLDLH
jgi:hypothetical protein